MRSPQHPHHRPDAGNRSMRLDPYAVEETTITLDEWRRTPAGQRSRPSAPRRRHHHPKVA